MKTDIGELERKGVAARLAARRLAKLPSIAKDSALSSIADGLMSQQEEILEANDQDASKGRQNGLSEALLDRLLLTPKRLEGMAEDVRKIAVLPDPVGEIFDMRVMPNGLQVSKRRVPLGVIGAIYESRPNVTVDISTLCLKSGNAVILRGGREAAHSNRSLARLISKSVAKAGIPADAVQIVESADRAIVGQMLKMRGTIDLIIPRGSQDLINRVAAEATMPAITGGVGVCHTYVDKDAEIEMAVEVVNNAKVQRPSVCNALDTVLVHAFIAPTYLPQLAKRWGISGVEMRCDRRAMSILGPSNGQRVRSATDDDWSTEFLSLTAAVKIVDTLEEALEHIETYGTGHSDAIITEDQAAAKRFIDEVDSSAVMVNASTRFNDGGQFGLGGEVAISTNKMHARGPVGLRELTSYKWTAIGTGQVRT